MKKLWEKIKTPQTITIKLKFLNKFAMTLLISVILIVTLAYKTLSPIVTEHLNATRTADLLAKVHELSYISVARYDDQGVQQDESFGLAKYMAEYQGTTPHTSFKEIEVELSDHFFIVNRSEAFTIEFFGYESDEVLLSFTHYRVEHDEVNRIPSGFKSCLIEYIVDYDLEEREYTQSEEVKMHAVEVNDLPLFEMYDGRLYEDYVYFVLVNGIPYELPQDFLQHLHYLIFEKYYLAYYK